MASHHLLWQDILYSMFGDHRDQVGKTISYEERRNEIQMFSLVARSGEDDIIYLLTLHKRSYHSFLIQQRNSSINNGRSPVDSEVAAAEADAELELAFRNQPLLGDDVPVAEVTPHDFERDLLALADAEVRLLEPTKLLHRSTLRRAVGESDIQLGNLCTITVASIGHSRRDVVESLPQSGVATRSNREIFWLGGDVGLDGLDGQVGELEGRVRKTESEFVADIDVLGIEVTVVNFETFLEVHLPGVLASVVADGGDRRGIVVIAIVSDGVGQFPGRVVDAVEGVDHGLTALCSGV
ncbi:putative beta-glucosidase [Hortaea werneckii]|nr:putative beta-glucosidase [Hortaea werneckii]